MYQCFVAVGRLGRDPHVTTTPTGVKVATFNLATSEFVKGDERTEWHRVVVWDEKLIEVLERRAAKGTLVAIEGQVRTRKWEKDGREGATTEIVIDRFSGKLRVLNGARSTDDRAASPEAAPSRPRAPRPPAADILSDELPF